MSEAISKSAEARLQRNSELATMDESWWKEFVDILVAIPAYNESVSIGSTVLASKKYSDRVIVVDDGSIDDTASIAELSEATVLKHSQNRGKGQAMKTIFDHARSVEFDVLVVLDGDGQHDPDDIPNVAQPVIKGSADMVIGSRYLNSGVRTDTPVYRRVGQRTLDKITNMSAGTTVTDTQSGFRAFSREAVDRLDVFENGMGVESEMIRNASGERLRIAERPISVRYEGLDGQTLNPLRHGIGVLLTILRRSLGKERDRRTDN